MAYTKIQQGSNADDSGATAVVTVTLGANAGAGRLVVAAGKWEGANGATCTYSGAGGGSWVSRPVFNHPNNDLHTCWGYNLVVGGGAAGVTMTLNGNRAFKHLHVWEYNYTGVASFLADNPASVVSPTQPASGLISPTGTDLVVMGLYGEYSGATPSAPLINGVAADGSIIDSPGGTFTASWYRILTSGFTNGGASITLSAPFDAICDVIAFDATAGGGGGSLASRRGGLGHSLTGSLGGLKRYAGRAWQQSPAGLSIPDKRLIVPVGLALGAPGKGL